MNKPRRKLIDSAANTDFIQKHEHFESWTDGDFGRAVAEAVSNVRRNEKGHRLLFHTTTQPAAQSILESGFRDGQLSGIVGVEVLGVSLSIEPVDCNQGANGDTVIEVEVPDSLDLASYFVIEEGAPAAWE